MCHTPACICIGVVCVSVDVYSADDLCPHWHQVKVMTENELLGYACEQFLGKSVVEIKSVILQTLEGHLRAILGGYLLKAALSLLVWPFFLDTWVMGNRCVMLQSDSEDMFERKKCFSVIKYKADNNINIM